MSILNATHLKKYYGKDESLVKALDDVNLSAYCEAKRPDLRSKTVAFRF